MKFVPSVTYGHTINKILGLHASKFIFKLLLVSFVPTGLKISIVILTLSSPIGKSRVETNLIFHLKPCSPNNFSVNISAKTITAFHFPLQL